MTERPEDLSREELSRYADLYEMVAEECLLTREEVLEYEALEHRYWAARARRLRILARGPAVADGQTADEVGD